MIGNVYIPVQNNGFEYAGWFKLNNTPSDKNKKQEPMIYVMIEFPQNDSLVSSIENGDLASISKHLNNETVAYQVSTAENLLHIACKAKVEESVKNQILKMILEKNIIDVHLVDPITKLTPLEIVSNDGNKEAVK